MNIFTLKKLFFAALLITLLSLAVFTGGCDVITGAQASYEEAIATARTELWKGINQGTASSGAAAIMDGGKIVYVEGFGMADRAKSVPVDNNTLFNIGSISKVYVAAAIMILVDEGNVALDTPVTHYLPDFTMADERYKDITVRML
ncbi:MAG: beta-lactamase family protein, partial [Candidatus Thermoplasmatota archaeon]|nr:beta-lactamase family protein [Candidatus Thermoplasmatota archaeon]